MWLGGVCVLLHMSGVRTQFTVKSWSDDGVYLEAGPLKVIRTEPP